MVDVRAVVFDYGGTLTDSRPDLDGYSERISQELSNQGYSVEPPAFKAAFRESGRYRIQVRADRIELTATDFFSYALDLLNIPPEENLIENSRKTRDRENKKQIFNTKQSVYPHIYSPIIKHGNLNNGRC